MSCRSLFRNPHIAPTLRTPSQLSIAKNYFPAFLITHLPTLSVAAALGVSTFARSKTPSPSSTSSPSTCISRSCLAMISPSPPNSSFSTYAAPSLPSYLDDPSLLQTTSFLSNAFLPDSSCDAHFDVLNPATGTVVATMGTRADTMALVDEAVASCVEAAHKWKACGATQRSKVLREWFKLMTENKTDLAKLMVLENGKPMAEAVGEVNYAASYVEWFAEEAKRLYGYNFEGASGGAGGSTSVVDVPLNPTYSHTVVVREPVGVCAAITPWNFPAAMITRKVAAALAAGCTMVVKPSELTPLTALALVELARRAGVPKGVINVVVSKDAKAVGEALCGSKDIKKVSFTGSTNVGKILLALNAETVKKSSMELGGLAPFIVMDDADLDAAAAGLIANKFRNAGQTCICANRVYVHEKVYDQFVEKVVAKVDKLVVGPGTEPGVTIGPLINKAAKEKVQSLVDDALSKGAKMIRPTTSSSSSSFSSSSSLFGPQSLFFAPTVLTDVSDSCLVSSQEIFGPVLPFFRFQSEHEVIARANDTIFGLAAYLYTRDVGRVWRMSAALEYGMVGVNEAAISDARAPFGGVKQSGMGREGSRYGLDDYLNIKYVLMGGLAK